MPTFVVTTPDGREYEVDAPEGATQEQVLAYAKQQASAQEEVAREKPREPMSGMVERQMARGFEDDNPVQRQFGLATRAGIQGVSSLATLPGDVTAMAGRTFGIPALEKFGSSAALDSALTGLGLPQAENETEQKAQNIARGIASPLGTYGLGSGMARSGNEVAQGVGRTLTARPTMQVAGTAGGVAGGEYAREQGWGPIGQMGASMLGSTAASVPFMVSDALRGALRGGEAGRQQMVDRMGKFKEADVDPMLGEATGNRRTQALDSILAKMPGSAGVYARRAQEEADRLGITVGNISRSIAPRADQVTAGNVLNFKRFKDAFQATQQTLYNKLDIHIPGTRTTDLSNTLSTLRKLNADIPGAKAVSEIFKNPKLTKIEAALKVDTGGTPSSQSTILSASGRPFMVPGAPPSNAIPYQAVKELRSTIGREIGNPSLAPDVPKAALRQLYAALSQDMEGAAAAAGPRALEAFKRANAYTQAGHNRMEAFLESVQAMPTPEQRYASVVGSTARGPTKFNAAMRSLEPGDQDVVRAAKIGDMGLATPGNQNAGGNRFSPNTFLTDWNKIDPRAMPTLLAGRGGATAKGMRNAAEVASMMRDAGRVGQNPSGTAPAIGGLGAAGGIGGSILTGHADVAAGIGGGLGGANLAARKLMDPAFQRWLALRGDPNPLGAIYSRNLLDLIQ